MATVMRLAFRLRQEYEGLVGASVKLPPTGAVFDVSAKLREGNGVIHVNNSITGNVLRRLRGSKGPLLDGFVVPEDSTGEQDWEPLSAESTAVGSNPPVVDEINRSEEHRSAVAELRQGWSEGMRVDELRRIASLRGIDFAKHSTKAEVMEALRASDQEIPDVQGEQSPGDVAEATDSEEVQ